MAMGIELRISEFGGNAFLEPLRNKVFEPLCLFMHFFDRIVEHLIKKGLDEPVVTQHFQSALHSNLRKQHPAMPLVLDQWLSRGRQLLQHIRN